MTKFYTTGISVIGTVLLTWGLSALIEDGLWIYIAMTVIGTVILCHEVFTE